MDFEQNRLSFVMRATLMQSVGDPNTQMTVLPLIKDHSVTSQSSDLKCNFGLSLVSSLPVHTTDFGFLDSIMS